MPIYEYLCKDCGKACEIIVTSTAETLNCPHCDSEGLVKLMSASSSMSGAAKGGLPGAGDTACCGSSPSAAGCAGPGSCCGKAH